MDSEQKEQEKQVVKISVMWLLLGAGVMVVLGMFGGVMASLIWPPTLPLTADQQVITTTVQEVTISPNKAAADIIAKADKSVVGIAADEATINNHIANGVVVTNDGLIVTSARLPKSDLQAIDHQGRRAALSLVGTDEMYGLTYLKFEEGVVGPIDMRKDPIPAGNELLLLARAKLTFLPHVEKWFLREWVLPPEINAAGIQRLWRGTITNDLTLNSGALIDDEGRLAGLVLNGPAGLALGADDLSLSMQRLANGKRETDPLRDFGVSLYYKLHNDEAEGRKFIAEVTSVAEDSLAARSGVRVRDEIVGINGSTLDWNKSIVNLVSEQPLRELSVRRGTREELLVITVSTEQQ